MLNLSNIYFSRPQIQNKHHQSNVQRSFGLRTINHLSIDIAARLRPTIRCSYTSLRCVCTLGHQHTLPFSTNVLFESGRIRYLLLAYKISPTGLQQIWESSEHEWFDEVIKQIFHVSRGSRREFPTSSRAHLSCTHTHSFPCTGPIPKMWINLLRDRWSFSMRQKSYWA